jgi:hypothetical protein
MYDEMITVLSLKIATSDDVSFSLVKFINKNDIKIKMAVESKKK